MCDTLCVRSPEGTLFAKNSDRPSSEVQLPEVLGPRAPGGRLRTQYLELEDAGAATVVLSRPDWLWGAEHGFNEHGVAIGNEKVDTVSRAAAAPPALIGMDLVRLGLERGNTADSALDAMTSLLERHGQGGIGDRTFAQAYDSSFLVADAKSAWILETAGRTWAAQPVVAPGAAISNRLTIRTGWTRASRDVHQGADFDTWRDPTVATGYADVRLAASRSFLGDDGGTPSPVGARQMVAHLRDHGTGPWGAPGERMRSNVAAPPATVREDGTGVTVCMHVGGLMATTASMVVLLPETRELAIRSWVAVGSPCVSVYVPLFGIPRLPSGLVDARLWHLGAALRDRVEADGGELERIRDVLDAVEDELWAEADELSDRPDRWDDFYQGAWRQVAAVLAKLAGEPSGQTREEVDRCRGP